MIFKSIVHPDMIDNQNKILYFSPDVDSAGGNAGKCTEMMKTRHSYIGNPFLGTWISIAIV